MQLKLYAICAVVVLSIVFQDHLASGENHEDSVTGSKAVEIRRDRRGLVVLKTAVVAGVIGLIAGLVIGAKKSHGRHGHYVKTSYHHPHMYRKRSIGDEDPVMELVEYDDDDLVRAAEVLDNLGCGGRLICELHQKTPSDLDNTGRKLVNLFNDKQAPAIERLQRDPKVVFQYAAFVGSNSPKDLKACTRVFPRCPLNAQEILLSFYEAKLPTLVPKK